MNLSFRLLLFFLVMLATQVRGQQTISGKVVSGEDGQPMPGVNVVIKGTSTGTVTEASGTYKLDAPTGAVLIFSFVGTLTQEITVGQRTIIDITMKPDPRQLEEIVVTGYREENRKALPGSVAIVKSEKLQNVPIASFDQVLQGRVPGMLVSGGSGQPGSSASVIIRGIKSLSGSNSPLYVLDGVPIATGVFNTLNPNDFESISVLKDATAAALYGSRGANGVIIITTKKGRAGDTQVNYTFQYGVSSAPVNRLQVMNSSEKIDFELLTGGSSLDTLTSEELRRLRDIDTDWQKVLFTEAFSRQHDLSFQGGNDKSTFFISLNYLDQEGTVRNTGLKRYTGKFNLQHEAGNFRLGFFSTLGYSKNQNTFEGNSYIGSPLNAVRWSNPYEKPFDGRGDYTSIKSGQPNALQELLENRRLFFDVKGIINMNLEYFVPAVKNLSIKTSWGTDYTQRESDAYYDKSTYTGQQTPGQSGSQQRSNRYVVNFVGTTSINYKTSFGNDHELFGSVYHEIVYNQIKGTSFTGYGLTSNLKNDGGITVSPVFLPSITGSNTESALQSFFSEFSYSYRNRYFAKASIRTDVSSRFGRNFQQALFYSFGANWLITEEPFFRNLTNKVDLLKLYSNVGTSGNQTGFGDFGSLSLFVPGATYDGSTGLLQAQPENPDLSWETLQSFNVGIEYATFGSRLKGSIEYYVNTTLDMLLETQLSRTSGFESLTQNVGSMQNRGIEIDIDANVLQLGNFTWNVAANFTYNKNEILKLVDGNEIASGLTLTRVGLPAFTNYVVPYAGVNSANGDALYYARDGSLTNNFSTNDLVPNGTRFAPRFGGFSNSFAYKGIDLSIFFSWAEGNLVYNNDRANVENPTYYVDNMSKSILNAWKRPGDITDVPRIQTKDGLTTDPFQAQTSRYVEDGSYLRLRNVSLSYSLPEKWISRAKLRSVRLFVQGQNLLTFFRFQGWDPELAAGFLTGAQYPALRTVTGGITIGL